MGFSKEWFDILNEIANFQQNRDHTWFRGQTNAAFQLNSGLYRNQSLSPTSYISTENAYYKIFKRMGHTHHNEEGWNLLYLMQHYGVKTRLLDWTESFAAALFFAHDNWDYDKNEAAIWLLDTTSFK